MKSTGTGSKSSLTGLSLVGVVCLIQSFLVLIPVIAFAATPTISLVPPDLYIEPGEVCTLQVMVDCAVDSLSCVEVRLSFDPSVLNVVNVLEGSIYATAPWSTFFDWEQESVDTLLAVDCVLGYRSFVLAPGELFSFVFEGVLDGFTVVRISSIRLWDIDRNELDVDTGSDAAVHVSTVSSGDLPPGRSAISNYPNPFNPATTISVDIAGGGNGDHRQAGKDVVIGIYDPAGRVVSRLFEGPLEPGTYRFEWNGRHKSGRPAVSGVYFALLRMDKRTLRRKLVLLR